MTEQTDSSGRPFLRAIGGILRFLIRLVLALIVVALIGVGIYYAAPLAYRSLVWPVQDNRARVAIMEQRMDLEQQHLQERDRALQNRIFELETEVAGMETAITELREQATVQALDQQALGAQNRQLDDRLAQLNSELEAQQQEMEAVAKEMKSGLGDATADLNKQIEDLQERLDDVIGSLTEQVEENQGNLDDVSARLGDLEGRLALLQTAQDLVKVRLLLEQEDLGTARNTLDLAIAHLDQARALMPSQAEPLENLRNQMTALDDLIAQRSFRARPDLEALWADVMDLVVPLTAQSTITATQSTSPLPTPTPSP
jgi:chromosome segregation ATPase